MCQAKVSVIVPVYNVERYLEKCLDSIINQTYKNLDIILVDDGSPDGCGLICDNYAAKDNRITVIHQQNGGLSAARNAGIKASTGEYLSFIDSDDYVQSHFIERMVEICEQKEVDICICGFTSVENQLTAENTSVDVYSRHDIIMKLCQDGTGVYTVAWNKIYKRYIFDELRFMNGRIHEDEAIMHKLLWRSEKTAVIEDCLYFYRHNEQSITNSAFSVKRLDAAIGYKERIVFFKELSEEKAAVLTEAVYCYFLRENFANIKKCIKNWKYWKAEMKSAYKNVICSSQVGIVKKISLSIHMVSPAMGKFFRKLK